MKTFDDLDFGDHPGKADLSAEYLAKMGPTFNVQARMDFDNGWGVSVIQGNCSYGGKDGLWELAVMHDGGLHYDNPAAKGDVCGYLKPEDVTDLMAQVQAFEADADVVAAEYKRTKGDDE